MRELLKNHRYLFIMLALGVLLIAGCTQTPKTTVDVSTLNIDRVMVLGELSASKVQFLHWQTSGVVDQVLAVGSVVKKDDQLAGLEAETLDQTMTQALSELDEIETLIEDRDKNHDIYLETANAAVRYFRKKVEAAENTYRNLDFPKLTQEELVNLEKNLSDAETEMNQRYVLYKQYRDNGEGAKKTQDAYLEWRAAEAEYEELRDWMDQYMSAPTDAEVVIARQKLEDARTQLDQALKIRDNIKSGDHRVLFRHNEGYDFYDPYSNYVFYSSDKWDPVNNTLDDQYEAKKLIADRMYQFAPFDGEIIFVESTVGESVSEGDRSVGLLDRGTLRVEVKVPEKFIPLIKIGDQVSMSYGSTQIELTGEIRSIDPISTEMLNAVDLDVNENSANITIDRYKSFEVVIDIDQKDIPIFLGAPVSVEFKLSDSLPVLAVPERTIQRDAEGEFVMVANLFGDEYKARINRGEVVNGLVLVFPINAEMLTAGDKIIDPVKELP